MQLIYQFGRRKMTGKRSCVDLDPDYEDISEHQAKRQRVLEQDGMFIRYFFNLLCSEFLFSPVEFF